MSDLQINVQDKIREFFEYEFVFDSGMTLTFPVAEYLGDTIEDKGDHLLIELSAKPGLDGEMLKPETVIIYKRTLAANQKRIRTIRERSVEEQAELKKLIHEVAKGVM